jgi:hypothetical protein
MFLLNQESLTKTGSSTVQFFRLLEKSDRSLFRELISLNPTIVKVDNIRNQLKELIRIEHPAETLDVEAIEAAVEVRLGEDASSYGCWVYYPWLHTVVHVLDEEEFFKVRSARNMHKITPEEQAVLRTKRVGVIGLSVGHAVAMALVMEGIGGELRLADFDTLDLSNCNRIQTSLVHLGLPKTEMALRDIAEINPFLKVAVYNEGITSENIDDFFTKNGVLDAVVEECDSGDVKLLARIKAKEYGVPLLMETSDRGVLDIERYDLEPNRPLLHGLLSANDYRKDLSQEEKRAILLGTIDFSKVSERGLFSMSEIGKSITTWPQLASDVISGGASVAMAARLILLGEKLESKRIYVDIASSIRGISK